MNDNYRKDIVGKSRHEILDHMFSRNLDGNERGRGELERQKAGLMVACIKDVEGAFSDLKDQLNSNALASDRLGAKVFWLNVILVVATIVGAFATAAIAWHTFFPPST